MQYLSNKGWRCQRSNDRLNFELPSNEHSESRHLLLPAEQSHPRFRSMLPNLIFSLAVLEQREALDIANAIADQQEPLPVAAPAADRDAEPAVRPRAVEKQDEIEWTLELVNNNIDKPITVHSRFEHKAITLASGQTIRVRGKATTKVKLQLAGDCELDYSGSTAPQLWLGPLDAQEQWRQRGWSLAEGLRDYLQTGGGEQLGIAPKNASSSVDDWIESAVAEFVFLVGGDTPIADSAALKRASARLLMQARNQLKTQPEPVRTAKGFELARLLMGLGQLVILADDSAAETLARTMELDQAAAPSKTLEWLSLHSRSFR